MDTTMDTTIATEIIRQMGGFGGLRAMIGAYDILAGDKHVMFRFKASRRANKCRVTLNTGDDLYRMEIFRLTNHGLDCKVVYDEDGLFYDQLQPEFERVTGCYLSL